MKKINIFVDMDGVVYDIYQSLEDIMRERGYDFSKEDILTYDLNKNIPDRKLPRREILEILLSEECFEREKPFVGAVEALKTLSTMAGCKITFYSLAATKAIVKIKERQLQRDFGEDFDYEICVGTDKPPAKNADIILEDCLANLRKYNRERTKMILVNSVHNQACHNQEYYDVFQNAVRVNNVSHFVNISRRLIS